MPAESRIETLQTDEEGFLLDPADWDRELAEEIARTENIEMTPDHWLVVDFVREYYEMRHSVPENRTLLRYLKERLGEEKATRKRLHALFPYGYGRQACKIAGMRKPRKLMLDV
ncbi:MAG: TusE/DsrC/DsvC family sulfur relay protein [Gammaproteobacteria bacterium]|nr:TusE/DsrC/DsvC family sulfur relay protein [Gammaproteobacteria bacterium]NIR83848.1 TusE/DsrC/DsvC family sulfur relay protein [Gammaproteobacteria bacterium]NIU04148.1 TusE/DsrC/DsvC family sulfur relay protein [Gammaproteobacteria bacterium]NIX85422.1 TusE/DsrC/DsvC family sulfur relay protein [Gammaproteobacteria bacterium]